jgi:hypothetical protein
MDADQINTQNLDQNINDIIIKFQFAFIILLYYNYFNYIAI